MLLLSSLSDYCAAVRKPRHLSTTDAAVPPASVLLPPPLVSWRSFLLAPRASAPGAASHCLPQRAPECNAALGAESLGARRKERQETSGGGSSTEAGGTAASVVGKWRGVRTAAQ